MIDIRIQSVGEDQITQKVTRDAFFNQTILTCKPSLTRPSSSNKPTDHTVKTVLGIKLDLLSFQWGTNQSEQQTNKQANNQTRKQTSKQHQKKKKKKQKKATTTTTKKATKQTNNPKQ